MPLIEDGKLVEDGWVSVGDGEDLVPGPLQRPGEERPHGVIVFCEEDAAHEFLFPAISATACVEASAARFHEKTSMVIER